MREDKTYGVRVKIENLIEQCIVIQSAFGSTTSRPAKLWGGPQCRDSDAQVRYGHISNEIDSKKVSESMNI